MRSSAEAIKMIRGHVLGHGTKRQVGQVIPIESDEIAGIGFDREFAVTVRRDRNGRPLDERTFTGGVMTGVLALRAVRLEPEAAAHKLFVGERVDGATFLRTRLQYMEPTPVLVPPGQRALSGGGRVTQVAVQNLLPGDGEQLDEYFAAAAAFMSGELDSDGPPAVPSLNIKYELPEIPGIPLIEGEDPDMKARTRYECRRLGFEALQIEHPVTRILALGTQGMLGEGVLMDWAEAFVAEPQQ